MKNPKPIARHFASDNNAGICPEAWAALSEANANHAVGYGGDRWTRRACDLIREVFEMDCDVYFVFNGSAANGLALASLCQSYHSVLCHRVAHVENDECGGPEFFTGGAKIRCLSGDNGKLTPKVIEEAIARRTDLHFPKTRAISLTQATELGTVYTPAELRAIGRVARRHDLKVHMDGARFANALASLDVAPKAITWQAGVDVLSFGATKNGVPVGEAVVFFDRTLSQEFEWRAKQAGQLASKMRFITAPWVGLLSDGAWLRHAAHANQMARRLANRLARIPGLRLLHPRQANAVFVQLPQPVIEALHKVGWHFYTLTGPCDARFMCAWDTTAEDVDAFATDLAALMARRDQLKAPRGQTRSRAAK